MDVRTNFYDSRTEKSIFLVLTFKYYLKYKAQSEAKSLVSGLAVTNNKAQFSRPISAAMCTALIPRIS